MSTTNVKERYWDVDKNVVRLRNSMPEKFFSLCLMHLSFVLDLQGDALEELLASEKPENRRRMYTPARKKKVPEKNGVFGSPLTQESVAVVFRLIEYLRRPENIKTEGLFRKTGNISRQKALKELLMVDPDLNLEENAFTPHDCAAVLKSFLAGLPEPLLLEKYHKAYCQLADMSSHSMRKDKMKKIKEKQLKALQLLILLLPRENSLLLELLLDLLSKVCAEKENMMTPESLGTIFSPHFLCPKKLSASAFQEVATAFSKLTGWIIVNTPHIFKIPKEFAIDVASFWEEMENPNKMMYRIQETTRSSERKSLVWSKMWKSDDAVNTCVNFADHGVAESVTDAELAKLYAYVQTMPESSKKRKYIKQFRNNGMAETKNSKHRRSKTFGASIRRKLPILKNKHRANNELPLLSAWSVNMSADADLRRACASVNRFHQDQKSECVKEASLKKKLEFNMQEYGETGSPPVHIVELSQSPRLPVRSRKRSADSILVSKDNSMEQQLPSVENEINYLSCTHHIKTTIPIISSPSALLVTSDVKPAKSKRTSMTKVKRPASLRSRSPLESSI